MIENSKKRVILHSVTKMVTDITVANIAKKQENMQQSIEQRKKAIAKELKKLVNAKKIDEQRKAECRAELGVGITTINRYLNGNIALLPVGESLLNFFKSDKLVRA